MARQLTKKYLLFIFFSTNILFFLYGYLFDKYHVFPYETIETLEQFAYSGQRSQAKAALNSVPINEERAKLFATFSRKADVVMIGDSLTALAEWDEIFPTVSISNRGIAGDSTEDLLRRMDSLYDVRAKKAFILIGTNDFLIYKVPSRRIMANYSEVIRKLAEHGTSIYIQSIPYCNEKLASIYVRCNEAIPKIAAFNSALEQLAKQNGYTYINLNSALSKNGELDAGYTVDGAHFNAEGYKIWANKISKYIN